STSQSDDVASPYDNANPRANSSADNAPPADDRLAQIVEAWPHLAEAARDELHERVSEATRARRSRRFRGIFEGAQGAQVCFAKGAQVICSVVPRNLRRCARCAGNPASRAREGAADDGGDEIAT
ncbi:MAG: hypothetical protein ACOC46_02495, partial [Pirellulales bacterium]